MPVVTIAYLALPVAAISLTISKADVFLPLRSWIYDRNEWLGELVRCPYCVAHWLSFGAVAIYQPRLVHSSFALLDYFASAMALVAIATIVMGLAWASIYTMATRR